MSIFSRLSPLCILALAAASLLAGSAAAQVTPSVLYRGNADPTTQGFADVASGSQAGITVGPVGLVAWEVSDLDTAGKRQYDFVAPDQAAWDAAWDAGFTLRFRVNAPRNGDNVDTAVLVQVARGAGGGERYLVTFGAPAGDLAAEISGQQIVCPGILLSREYTLEHDGSTGTATLSATGSTSFSCGGPITGLTPTPVALPGQVSFGSGSTGATGEGIYSLVELAFADDDGDGLDHYTELVAGTATNDDDSDDDGLLDGFELLGGLDPLDDGSVDPQQGASGDPDGDGVDNATEQTLGTGPTDADSDDDGFDDGLEQAYPTDPLDATDNPVQQTVELPVSFTLGRADVDVSGDTAVIASSGEARVYVYDGVRWSQQAVLTPSGGESGFGASVAIDGDTVLVGERALGSAYVFVRSGSTWTEQAQLTPSFSGAGFGDDVALDGDTAVVGAWLDNENGNDAGAAFVFVRSGTSWTEQARLTAGDGAEDDFFGWRVAVSGDTVAIGAPGVGSPFFEKGAVYVFERSGTSWSQQQKLDDGTLDPDGAFGASVALSGDLLLVGANNFLPLGILSSTLPGVAYAFVRTGTRWEPQATLSPSAGFAWDLFGSSIALQGDLAVVGAPWSLTATVFQRLGSRWVEQDVLAARAGDVALSGDLLVADRSTSDPITAYLFDLDVDDDGLRNDFEQTHGFDLLAAGDGGLDPDGDGLDNVGEQAAQSDPQVGDSDADGFDDGLEVSVGTRPTDAGDDPIARKLRASTASEGDQLGSAVALDGDTALVGAPGRGGAPAATVFVRSGAAWVEQAALPVPGGTSGSGSTGGSVALSGDTALVVSDIESLQSDSTVAYVFVRSGTSWSQQARLEAGTDSSGFDTFARVVALDGDTALLSAYYEDVGGNDAGAAYVFVRSGSTWSQQARLEADVPDPGDNFGFSLAVDGDTAVIGALWDDDGGADAGAAYVFTRSGTVWTQQAKFTGTAPSELAGFDVAVSGDTALVRSLFTASTPVFVRSGTSWSQQATLDPPAGSSSFLQGSLSLSGDRAAIGAVDDEVATNSGAVYVFTRSGGTWSAPEKLKALDAAVNDSFGIVSVSGDTVLVGAPNDDDDGESSGAVFLFDFDWDGDGLTNVFESDNGFDPFLTDDAAGDPDGDGLDNLGEQAAGTDPQDADSDDDGFSDGVEVAAGTDPLSASSFPDGVPVPAASAPLRLLIALLLAIVGVMAPSIGRTGPLLRARSSPLARIRPEREDES